MAVDFQFASDMLVHGVTPDGQLGFASRGVTLFAYPRGVKEPCWQRDFRYRVKGSTPFGTCVFVMGDFGLVVVESRTGDVVDQFDWNRPLSLMPRTDDPSLFWIFVELRHRGGTKVYAFDNTGRVRHLCAHPEHRRHSNPVYYQQTWSFSMSTHWWEIHAVTGEVMKQPYREKLRIADQHHPLFLLDNWVFHNRCIYRARTEEVHMRLKGSSDDSILGVVVLSEHIAIVWFGGVNTFQLAVIRFSPESIRVEQALRTAPPKEMYWQSDRWYFVDSAGHVVEVNRRDGKDVVVKENVRVFFASRDQLLISM